ncbi:DUF3987 domain-containing protein [Urechidicola vernalis]|uniref:DUF3987 domain-containing protein n=1 Tax=Urechidicola vernalis TaxID=3075600 RepID=A0ABU2Y764_9FLAO|nr:DUF3987 domain-containing protein [Urechidicola sp. P050]MDT0554041.1 DUF3987 domain-containing protein [Urechidicola sp. P050]
MKKQDKGHSAKSTPEKVVNSATTPNLQVTENNGQLQFFKGHVEAPKMAEDNFFEPHLEEVESASSDAEPTFNLNTLNDSKSFIDETDRARDKFKDKENLFPIEIFPKTIQHIIKETNVSLNYSVDYTGASMLFAASVAIGNSFAVSNGIYTQNATLYLALIGQRGVNKSHPLTFALRPLQNKDGASFKEYLERKKEYENIQKGSKKEAKELEEKFDPPVWQQSIVSDFTPEALVDIHSHNTKGLGVYSDELAGWFKNFNRYSKGSEEQFWLSVWSGTPIRVNRKSSEPIFIPNPFISVAGTIQHGVLKEMAKDRTENGFMDRLLFVIPENLKKEYWSEVKINPKTIALWETTINHLLELKVPYDKNNNVKPKELFFTTEAKDRIYEWQQKITDLSNATNDVTLKGIYAKIEPYAMRFSLILQMLHWATGSGGNTIVELPAVEGAIKFAEYFIKSAIKVNDLIQTENPLGDLPFVKQQLYDKLPQFFSTGEGMVIAESLNIKSRTYSRFIKEKELFSFISHGQYEKLF